MTFGYVNLLKIFCRDSMPISNDLFLVSIELIKLKLYEIEVIGNWSYKTPGIHNVWNHTTSDSEWHMIALNYTHLKLFLWDYNFFECFALHSMLLLIDFTLAMKNMCKSSSMARFLFVSISPKILMIFLSITTIS